MGERGRPRVEFDLVALEKLAALMCTDEEIAGFFDCSLDTIRRRKKEDPEFLRAYVKGKTSGRISLRRKQWKLAERSAPMAMFMGKNYLSQDDRRAVEVEGYGPMYLTVIGDDSGEE